MYQSLTGLPSRVVLDVNALLNACFVRDSSARFAISKLHQLGFQPVIDESIESEAKKILRRFVIRYSLKFDPAIQFDQYLVGERVILLPKATYWNHSKVNKADRHIYSAAKEYDAWVLTGDIELMAQCQSLAVPSRLPWDVLSEAATINKGTVPLNYALRFAGISKSQGSVFARIIPGSWAGMKNVGVFMVCEIENVMSLAYDSSNSSWSLSISGGGYGRLPLPITGQDHWTICGGFNLSPVNQRGSATLRAHSSSGCQNAVSFDLSGGPTAANPGNVSFGHSTNGECHWNGHIRNIVVSPRPVGKETWKALRANPDSTPDPSAADIVEAAFRRAGGFVHGIMFPSERELGMFWI